MVREKLVGKDGKWSLAGQSFGGMIMVIAMVIVMMVMVFVVIRTR